MKANARMAVAVLGILLPAGCVDGGDEPSVSGSEPPCGPAEQVALLAADLVELEPSATIEVPPGTAAWIRVTKRPTAAGGLFGEVGGVAELHSIPADAVPALVTDAAGNRRSADPSIVVRRALIWERADLEPGAWRLYSLSNPGIEVVACPA